MRLPRLLKWGCLTAGAVCLAVGYALIGQWWILGLAGLAWLAGVFAAGLSGIVLVVWVSLAAVGLCAGAAPVLMFLGATLALAGWDLASWESFMAGGLPATTAARLERKHYAYLALPLGSGLLAAILGRMVHFELPFGILVILASLALLGVDQVWRLVKG